MLNKTNLQEIDFNQLYIEQKLKTTFKAKSDKDWDKKADEMNERVKKSDYNRDFFNLVELQGCDTLLDVGCGVGNLSFKFAPHLKEVYAFDYSERMLELVIENAKELGMDNIKTFKQDIEQPWHVPKADIVIASRSVGGMELLDTLTRINNHANKRVYLSIMAGGSFVSDEILNVLDTDITPKPDYIYAVNTLHSLGIYAKVDFLDTYSRQGTFKTQEDFLNAISWSVGDLSNTDLENLKAHFQTLPIDENGEKISPSPTKWAIVSWEKTKTL